MEYLTTMMSWDECISVLNSCNATNDEVCIITFKDKSKESVIITDVMRVRDAFINTGKMFMKSYDWFTEVFVEPNRRDYMITGNRSFIPF